MQTIIELERKCTETTSDIEDILHAASLNFKALISEVQQDDINTLHSEFSYLDNMLASIKNLMDQRAPLFMNYLIIKQIQDQESRVRRERLVEYEEKIYDQKRIIGDKQTCFEQLQRPKRKRPTHQTPDQFHQMRARERQCEDRMKNQQLNRQIAELHGVKRIIMDQQRGRKKSSELEQTKSSSISQVSLIMGDANQILTERGGTPFEDRKNRPNHFRTGSMQHEFGKDSFFSKKEDTEEDYANARSLLSDCKSFKQQNFQLHHICQQAVQSLKFKKSQNVKKFENYQKKNIELKDAKEILAESKKEEKWKLNRVNSPVGFKRPLSP